MACALVAVTSCESMLEIPQKGVVSYDNFYASDDDALAAITSMYATYIDNVAGTEGIDNPEQVMLNYSADDIMPAGGFDKDHLGFREYGEFAYDNSNPTLKSAYERYVKVIYHANLVISNFTNENKIQSAPKHTSAYVDQVVAEARVMRAFIHMMMALSWERPPIVDRLQEGDDLPVQAESQADVLNWVIEQCKAAIDSDALPVRNGQTDKDATARMSLGFAQYVAGKAAVFLGDWKTAREYLGALIGSKNYDLIDSKDYWTNFHIAGDGNKEKIFEPNLIDDSNYFIPNGWGSPASGGIWRGRWMVANVFNWGVGKLASPTEVAQGNDGWNGGAIQEDFAKKFLAHDGDSPRRKACFLTEEEFLYVQNWSTSKVNDGTLEQKKLDDQRGIKDPTGLFSHGPYFEWKHMVYTNPPAILTGGEVFPPDYIASMGTTSNQKNFNVARFAEVLLLYAEACLPENGANATEQAEGLKALNKVQQRSGSNKITSLTFANVMEEKQYEMWFENCRFHDLVRWSKQRPSDVDLNKVFNESKINQHIPTVFDEFFIEGKPGYQKEHKLFTTYSECAQGGTFVVGKHEYFPFPHDYMVVNPNLVNFNGWASSK